MSRRRTMEVILASDYVSIGELARLTGCRYSTLKHYTEEGMLPFEQEEENLTRRYRRRTERTGLWNGYGSREKTEGLFRKSKSFLQKISAPAQSRNKNIAGQATAGHKSMGTKVRLTFVPLWYQR